jgi:hypothetical protein
MSDNPDLTRSDAVEQTLAQVDGPIAIDEFCERVLTIWPSKAKNPVSSMRTFLRQEERGRSLIFVDKQTLLPLPVAMRGVRFRIPISRREAKRGVLIIQPAFDQLMKDDVKLPEVELLDHRGRALPVRLTTIRKRVETPLGKHTREHNAFNMDQWFRAHRVRRDDSILVTIEDWATGRFRLEHEPARRRRQSEIEEQDRELARLLFDMLEMSRHERIYAFIAVPTAYARLSDPRGYPGSHWIQVINRDERMRYDGWAIYYSDWRSPLESMLFGREPTAETDFSPAQGRQVYRFKAALWNRAGLWRRIEIQGEQYLAEFDDILRDAFEHDTSDHMSGFWKRVRRGKGKRFREIDVGDVDPLGGGSGAEVQIAGLGLKPGDELKYVYDFGDWIEYRLTLEEIVEAEAEAHYPRIVAQNKPRYRSCETCRAEGRKARATWICIRCSNQQERRVLVCEDCLSREHEGHYADEILY